MLSAILAAVIFCSLILRTRDKALFLNWLKENDFSDPWKIYIAAIIADLMSITLVLGSLFTPFSVMVNFAYSLCATLLALVIKLKIKDNCPCFGKLSYSGAVKPVRIFFILAVLSLFEFIGSKLFYMKLTTPLVELVTFVVLVIFFSVGIKGGKIVQHDAGKLQNNILNYAKEFFGNDINSIGILYLSRECNICNETLAMVRNVIDSLEWKSRLFLIVEGFVANEETFVDGIKVISQSEMPIFKQLKIAQTPSLMIIDLRNQYDVFTGKASVIFGLIKAAESEVWLEKTSTIREEDA